MEIIYGNSTELVMHGTANYINLDLEYSKLVSEASEFFSDQGVYIKTLDSTYDNGRYIFTVNREKL